MRLGGRLLRTRRRARALDVALGAAHPGLVPGDLAPLVRIAWEVRSALQAMVLDEAARSRILARAVTMAPSSPRGLERLCDFLRWLGKRRPVVGAAGAVVVAAVVVFTARGRDAGGLAATV